MVMAATSTTLIDSKGTINRQIPNVQTSGGILGIISSPGTPSFLFQETPDESDILSLSLDDADADSPSIPCLACRGATLAATSMEERLSLTTTSLVVGALLVDGVTEGDIEMGLRNSRHARTLTALFRARQVLLLPGQNQNQNKQTLLLGVMGQVDDDDNSSNNHNLTKILQTEVEAIFDATAVELTGKMPVFKDMYDVVVLSVQSSQQAEQAINSASRAAAAAAATDESKNLSALIFETQSKIQESGVAGEALDPPHVAQAFLTCRRVYAKQAKTVRAKLAAWKARSSRGLTVDYFGEQAEQLLKKSLYAYDSETLDSAGLPSVAGYRLEMRTQLQNLLETNIEDLFDQQIDNLQNSVLKKFSRQLLTADSLTATAESILEAQSVAMRNAAFAFGTAVENIEVPALSLTKAKAIRVMDAKLTETMTKYPDSPQAKLKRMNAVQKTTNRKRKPASRAIDLGLDLVAMIRPDGFGSLQGFAGYQMGGNSLTVGVANDADDPQVIAQMGGVRPALIRVQPKLRVDVEL